jgi:hypothetical protein
VSKESLALVLCLVGMSDAVAAQDSVRLRFNPPAGLALHRVFQRHQLAETREGTQEPRVHEVTQSGGITQFVLQADGETIGIHLAIDSLRLRTRETGGAWSEAVVPGAETIWMQVVADDRLHVGLRAGELQPGVGGLLMQSLNGFPGATLPTHWLKERMLWRTELLVSPSDPLIPGDMDDVMIRTQATFVVDSIVRRAQDTLAYLTVSGRSARLRQQMDDGGMLAFSGSITGSLVWSTGYLTFVSVATRLNVAIEERIAGTPEPSRRMTIETTVHQAVVR